MQLDEKDWQRIGSNVAVLETGGKGNDKKGRSSNYIIPRKQE